MSGKHQTLIRALQMAADGISLEEAGEKLGLRYQTFRNYLHTFYREIGADNIQHAVAIAMRRGWIK